MNVYLFINYIILFISAHAHVHTALLYLRNGSADCVPIWCVGLESLPKCFAQVMGGVHPHVRTPFQYLGNGWRTVLKLSGWLGTQ